MMSASRPIDSPPRSATGRFSSQDSRIVALFGAGAFAMEDLPCSDGYTPASGYHHADGAGGRVKRDVPGNPSQLATPRNRARCDGYATPDVMV